MPCNTKIILANMQFPMNNANHKPATPSNFSLSKINTYEKYYFLPLVTLPNPDESDHIKIA